MKEDNKQIAIVWSIEDVKSVRKDLSDEQAIKVLKFVENNHDANIGVNWDVLEGAASELYPK